VAEEPVVEEGDETTEKATDEATEASPADGPATAAPAVEPAADRVAALESEIGSLSQEFGSRLVEYINSLEILDGEPLTPDQQKAIRMKSDEDIELAAEWIEKGGDYRRAIDIYSQGLALDPGYIRLEEALANATEMRFPSEERFAGVKKGMTQAEVRDILGPVNLHNVREYPDKNALAWFYPKDQEAGKKLPPSAVYFQMDDDTYKVYQTDYGIAEDAEDAETDK
jgi:hypothetical protein